MEWLIVPFIIGMAGWWIYVINRRKKREATKRDQQLREAVQREDERRAMAILQKNAVQFPLPLSRFNKFDGRRSNPSTRYHSKSEMKRLREMDPVGHQRPIQETSIDPFLIGMITTPKSDPIPYSGGGGESAGAGASASWDSGSSPSSSSSGGSDGSS